MDRIRLGMLLSSVVAINVSANESVEGATNNNKRRREGGVHVPLTNNSDDLPSTNNSGDTDKAHAVRVELAPFTITLRPTPFPLQGEQIENVHEVTEKVIEEYLLDTDHVKFEYGVSFEYLSLLGVDLHQHVTQGFSYCGTTWADANDNCNEPCTFGTNAVCPENQICFANTNSCPSSSSDRRKRRTLQGATEFSSDRGSDRRLESSYTVLKMAGGLATFEVDPDVNPGARPPTTEVLGTLAASGVSSKLTSALRNLHGDTSNEDSSQTIHMYTSLGDIAQADAVPSISGIPDDASAPIRPEPAPQTPPMPETEGSTPQAPSAPDTEGMTPQTPSTLDTEGSFPQLPSTLDIEGADPVTPTLDTEGAGGNEKVSVFGATMQEGKQIEGKQMNPTGAIAGAVVGAAIVVLLIALYIRRTKKGARENRAIAESDIESQVESNELSGSDDLSSSGLNSRSLETIPEKDDDDEMADSSTNWKVGARKYNELSQASHENESLGTVRSEGTSLKTGVPMHPTDSFEIRRQFESISVRKDMMVTTSLERDTRRTHAANTERNRQPASADMEDRGNLMSYPYNSVEVDTEQVQQPGVADIVDKKENQQSAISNQLKSMEAERNQQSGFDDTKDTSDTMTYPHSSIRPNDSDDTWTVVDRQSPSAFRPNCPCAPR